MKVLNAKHGFPRDAVYVGRPSRWGNPFVVGKHGKRGECIALHKEWIQTQPDLMRDLHMLRGKDLVCWCAPEPCHAETLMELANPGYDKETYLPF